MKKILRVLIVGTFLSVPVYGIEISDALKEFLENPSCENVQDLGLGPACEAIKVGLREKNCSHVRAAGSICKGFVAAYYNKSCKGLEASAKHLNCLPLLTSLKHED